MEDGVLIIHMVNAVRYENVKNIRADLFNRYVLRPLWNIYIILSFICLFNREWSAGFFLAAICPLIIIIGKGLCAAMADLEVSGMPLSQGEIESTPHIEGPSEIEDILINKAIFMVAVLIAITAMFFAWRYGLGWYGVIATGGAVWLLSMIAIPACSQYLIPARANKL